MARLGQFYTLDALLATALILSAVLLLNQFADPLAPEVQTQYAAQDVLMSLNTLTLAERDEPFIQDIQEDTLLTGNDTIMYAMGYLWTINDSRAQQLAQLANQSVPARLGLRLDIEDNTLFLRPKAYGGRASASIQQITGIDEGRPVAGTSSSAYLTKLSDKQTASYAYLGGFTGQGNITVQLALPADVTPSRISSFQAILDTPQSFTLEVNGVACANPTPTTPPLEPDKFTLTGCIPELNAGSNDLQLTYTNLTEAYVSGGYFVARYTTDEFITTANQGIATYSFPQIEGVANIYDGIQVPGTLQNLSAQLHYKTLQPNVLTYFTVGEKTVYESNQTGEVVVNLDNNDFLAAGIDYNLLSNSTVPIRFASFNATTQEVEQEANADVVIITDYSGSMRLKMTSDEQGESADLTNCEDDVYTNPDVRRSHVARCLDKQAVRALLNYTGNRVYPVHFYNLNQYEYINPEDEEALLSFYETYTSTFPELATGGTPLASSLSKAYDVFDTYSNSSREQVIIFMSDGLASHCARDPDVYYQPGPWWCPWCGSWQPSEDVNNPQCDNRDAQAHVSTTCSGSATSATCAVNGSCQPGLDNAEAVASMLANDFNATIYTVALGPVSDCSAAQVTLQNIATLTGGTYQGSADIDELRGIYENISYSIIDQLELQSQELLVPTNVTSSTLFDDSFVTAQYTPNVQPAQPNEIEITRQTAQFGCSATVNFPSDVRVRDAVLSSFSGPHWTDEVVVNGVTIHDLSDYFVSYPRLGDPHRIAIPPSLLSDSTTISLRTGDAPDNATGCSQNNSLVYSALLPSSTSLTPVLETAEGCTWTVEQETGGVLVVPIPGDYTGSLTCSYTSADISYDPLNAVQRTTYELLNKLDFSDNGRVFVGLQADDLEVVLTQVQSVPFLWGPVLVRAEVWQ